MRSKSVFVLVAAVILVGCRHDSEPSLVGKWMGTELRRGKDLANIQMEFKAGGIGKAVTESTSEKPAGHIKSEMAYTYTVSDSTVSIHPTSSSITSDSAEIQRDLDLNKPPAPKDHQFTLEWIDPGQIALKEGKTRTIFHRVSE